MSLASLEDVSRWLAEDKLEVNEASITPFEIEAERTIKAMLSGVFTATVLSSWDTPANTPPLISSVAGELIAAYIYREAYSEDESTVPPYAQMLYTEAIDKLKGIRSGALVVLDSSNIPVESTEPLTAADFYPNDAAPEPKFTMEKSFG